MTEFTHEIALPGPPDTIFPLFTPKGEEAWVPGWRPRYIAPADGATGAEMLFETGAGDDRTIWTCLAFEPRVRHARYLRVTPASRAAIVDVCCRAMGPGHTVARVSYRYHALTAEGTRQIAAMTPAGFAAEIETWRNLIHAHLGSA